MVDDSDDILLISDDGTIIRTAAADISIYGRAAQGVRIMRLSEGAKVISIARTEHEEPEEAEAEAEAEAETGTESAPETPADNT